mgnify:CR=1 FL=1
MLTLQEVDLSSLEIEESDQNWFNVTMNALKDESKSKVFKLLCDTKSLLEKREESRYKLVKEILEILTSDEKNN